MKKYIPDIFACLAILMTISVFFFRFFWPQPQLVITPDFGTSDAVNSSFARKFILAESLKKGEIPLWTPLLGGGVPFLAEAPGFFFLPNLIFFRFFPIDSAYNLFLTFSVLLAGWGTYLWMRSLRLSPFSSLFAGITIVTSGIIIPRLTHIMVLPAIALLPWIMYTTQLLADRISRWHLLLFIFAVSQLFFINFPQATFIILLFSGAYFLFLTRAARLGIAVFGGCVILAMSLSAIQLVPTWEYYRQSAVSGGFSPRTASYFSFPLRHLVTFINPFALGNPRVGSYPPFTQFDGSVFWENSGYVGIFPLLLFAASVGRTLVLRKKAKGKGTLRLFFWGAMSVSFLLMLGKYSPLYLIYSIPPFSTFRVPSRFLWVFVFSLVAIATIELDNWWRKARHSLLTRIVLVLAFIANTSFVINGWWGYHALASAKTVLEEPATLAFLDPAKRVATIGFGEAQNALFTRQGWVNPAPYIFLNTAFEPNVNVLWGISQLDTYSALRLRRSALVNDMLSGELMVTLRQATASAQAVKLLRLSSVGSVISLLPLDQNGLTIKTTLTQDPFTIRMYNNPNALPRAYIVRTATSAASVAEAARIMKSKSFIPGQTVLLEKPDITEEIKPFFDSRTTQSPSRVQILRETTTQLDLAVSNDGEPALLVLTDTWYPGWRAAVDGQSVPLYSANLAQRAVVVPGGKHTVSFHYQPESFKLGVIISSLAIFVIAFLMALPFEDALSRIGKKAPRHGLRLSRNRDR